jgi:hypothetical protein
MDVKNVLILDLILEHIPNLGEFTLSDKMKLIDDRQWGVITKNFTGQQYTNVIDYLYTEGFVAKTNKQIKLTHSGRKLKECGSLVNYYRYTLASLLEQETREKRSKKQDKVHKVKTYLVMLMCLIGFLSVIHTVGVLFFSSK